MAVTPSLVAAEIDQAITPLVAAATMPRRNDSLIDCGHHVAFSVIVSARGSRCAGRKLGKIAHTCAAAAWRCRIVSANAHVEGSEFRVQDFRRSQSCVPNPTSRSPFSNLACGPSETGCGAACLCDFGCALEHFHVEQFFDGFAACRAWWPACSLRTRRRCAAIERCMPFSVTSGRTMIWCGASKRVRLAVRLRWSVDLLRGRIGRLSSCDFQRFSDSTSWLAA